MVMMTVMLTLNKTAKANSNCKGKFVVCHVEHFMEYENPHRYVKINIKNLCIFLMHFIVIMSAMRAILVRKCVDTMWGRYVDDL